VERFGNDGVLDVRCAEVNGEGFEPWEDLGWDVEPIFRSIWPGDGDWFNEWQAFPSV
jgi:hypothetical protein